MTACVDALGLEPPKPPNNAAKPLRVTYDGETKDYETITVFCKEMKFGRDKLYTLMNKDGKEPIEIKVKKRIFIFQKL